MKARWCASFFGRARAGRAPTPAAVQYFQTEFAKISNKFFFGTNDTDANNIAEMAGPSDTQDPGMTAAQALAQANRLLQAHAPAATVESASPVAPAPAPEPALAVVLRPVSDVSVSHPIAAPIKDVDAPSSKRARKAPA